jgi:tRNA threonylcarbamoyladenosine biosynthesis protein TsaE
MEYLSKSEKETYLIAAKLAKEARGGDIFALHGDLGSGKTTFTKGFALELGVLRQVTSPTFVIVKSYQLHEIKGRKPEADYLIHADCYRLSSAEDAETVGLSDYFQDKNVISLLEWPENIEKSLPKRTKKINFKYIDEQTRVIEVPHE